MIISVSGEYHHLSNGLLFVASSTVYRLSLDVGNARLEALCLGIDGIGRLTVGRVIVNDDAAAVVLGQYGVSSLRKLC